MTPEEHVTAALGGRVVICGSTCGHRHDSPNGPSGCCDKHGPYLYFCRDCHDEWKSRRKDADANA